MKVIAYCLKNYDGARRHLAGAGISVPVVPVGLIVEDQGFVWKGERFVDGEFVAVDLNPPVEIPDDSWLGIESDKSYAVLARSEQAAWRISHATRAVEESQKPISGPESALHAVRQLHIAADLMGVRVSELHAALLRVRKSPNEPLEVTVRALIEEMQK